MTTGYISLDIMLSIMLCSSALFTIVGILYPVGKRLGIIYEDGVIEFGQSDISLRIRPQLRFERYKEDKRPEPTDKTTYY